MSAMFLDEADIVKLTDKKAKSKQIDALRRMGIPFFVNATGHPVVTRSAIEGKQNQQVAAKLAWTPRVLKAG